MSLVRSSLIVGAASVTSKVLGFVRDVLFAQVLGAGPVADAFLAAFRLPNLLRRAMSEGGFNPALVPLLARLSPAERPAFVGQAFAGLAVLLLAALALVEIAAGLLVLSVAPGLGAEDGAFDLAVLYTRITFPLVIGVALASFLAAALNHSRLYTAAAVAPLALNVALIAAALAVRTGTLAPEEKAMALAAAASAGGLAHLAIVAAALRGRSGVVRWGRPRLSPALGRLVGACFATVVASGAAQLFVLVGSQVASFLPSGVSWLYYADRLVQLPMGIVASVAGVVLLPELAAHSAAGDRFSASAAQNKALETALLIAVPAATALAVLAGPMASVLFERGAFGPEDSAGTAAALLGLSFGLPFAVAGKILEQTLFAKGAMREALAATALGLAATGAAALVLSVPLGILGVGLGIALGCLVHAAALGRALRRAGLWRIDAHLALRTGKILAASLCLGVALAAGRNALPPSEGALLLLCGGGLAFYLAAAWLLGAITPDDVALLAKKA